MFIFIADLLANVLLTETITITATAEKNNFFIIVEFKLLLMLIHFVRLLL